MNCLFYNTKQIHNLEYCLALHCAPALAGIKPANLVSLKKNRFPECIKNIQKQSKLFNAHDIYFYKLSENTENYLYLVYKRDLLFSTIRKRSAKQLLLKFGYHSNWGLSRILRRLAERISECEDKNDYPHEIGIFLGYPVSDVIGFMYFKGDNYKLCGYWKVYSNLQRAEKLFKAYDAVKDFYCALILQGQKIHNINFEEGA